MPKVKAAKFYRKIRLSGSVDVDAFNILKRIAEDEKRSISNALNRVLYEAGERRGMEVPNHRKDDHGSGTGEV